MVCCHGTRNPFGQIGVIFSCLYKCRSAPCQLSPGIWWTSGAVQGMCMGRNLHGGLPCPPHIPWYQGLGKPGSGPALRRSVCACCTLAWSELCHRSVTLSECGAELQRGTGTQALIWGSPQAQRGYGGVVPCCCWSLGVTVAPVYLSLKVLHIQKTNLSDYTQVTFLSGTDFCPPHSKHF